LKLARYAATASRSCSVNTMGRSEGADASSVEVIIPRPCACIRPARSTRTYRQRQKRVLRAPPGREDIGAESVRGAGIWSGWFEKAQDQKPRFLAQLLVVLGIAFTHRFGWDRLDEFFDEESGIGGSRAQS
jgi:hypothetical protein